MSGRDTNLPLVSIVTPSLNSARFIGANLQSVAEQDYPNIEHIVVDGASRDETVQILRAHPGVRWVSEPDRGQADALNKGFALARGEVIGWLNSDDTYNPGAVSHAVSSLLASTDTGMVYSNCNIIDAAGMVTSTQISAQVDLAQELLENNIPQQTVFAWNDKFRGVRGVRPVFDYVMDYDLWLRLGLAGVKMEYVDAIWANFRICEGTKTSTYPARFWLETLAMLQDIFSQAGNAETVCAVKYRAYARALWTAGVFLQASDSESLREEGISYCQQALKIFPLLQSDSAYVHGRLTYLAAQEDPISGDAFVRHVFKGLREVGAASKRDLRRSLAHYYASLYLVRGQCTDETDFATRSAWLAKAVGYDPTWLANLGILAAPLREFRSAVKRHIGSGR